MSKVPKITIEEDRLEMFMRELNDVSDLIRLELHQINPDSSKIRDLLDQLSDAWTYVYDPISITTSRALHTVYGLYCQASRSGESEKAQNYLTLYKNLLSDRQTYY